MNKPKIAFYPGSFDPPTNGHIDLILRGAKLFDQFIVGIGCNPDKHAMFTPEERLDLLRRTLPDNRNISVVSYSGLLLDAVRHHNACAIIRGLRNSTDFEWEFQWSVANKELAPECETVFLTPQAQYAFISSSMVKQLKNHKALDRFVPPIVAEAIRQRYAQKG